MTIEKWWDVWEYTLDEGSVVFLCAEHRELVADRLVSIGEHSQFDPCPACVLREELTGQQGNYVLHFPSRIRAPKPILDNYPLC